jgi:Tfp pilus assembly protein PilF
LRLSVLRPRPSSAFVPVADRGGQFERHARLLHASGLLAMGTDDLELAAQEFDHAPHIDAQLVAARASRAAPAQATGDPDAAIEDLTVAIELDAGNPDLLYNRGFVDHSAGRFREAIDDCSRALVLPDADETELLRRRTMCEVIGNRAGRACQPWNAGTVRSASSA